MFRNQLQVKSQAVSALDGTASCYPQNWRP